MTWIGYVAAGSALVALWLMVSGLRRCRRRRLASGLSRSGLGLVLFVAGLGVAGLALHLHTYQRLTGEQPVADIAFTQVGAREYAAQLTPARGESMKFLIHGDEWQLDARFVKWKGPAVVAGLDPLVRLDRIAGRYRDISEERSETRSVYDLAHAPGPDLFRLINRHPRWLPWIDTVYGSAAYMPMADGARYVVSASPSGLVARPLDQSTARLLQDW